jgi:nucleoside-diphosphate-sugar epimerase
MTRSKIDNITKFKPYQEKKMKYLIIGGTGLISTPMTHFLIEKGEDVTIFNRGQRKVRFPPGAKILYGDRTDYSPFQTQMKDAGNFDFVIDMICFKPNEAESAVLAFKGRIEQYIFCSTVDVYSKPSLNLPYKESEPRQGLTEYGKNKILCEDIFMEAHRNRKFKTTIIRPAATYGEGGTIIHTFGWSTTYLDRIQKGKPIVVHGDGSSLWVMCYIDDVARAHIAACGNEKSYGKAYHATGEEWMTWNQYHEQVAQALDAPKPKIVHIPTDILDQIAPQRSAITTYNFQYNNVFDNSAAKQDLNFAYTIPFIDGVRRTVSYLDQNNMIQNSDDDPFDDRVIQAWEELRQEYTQKLEGLGDQI